MAEQSLPISFLVPSSEEEGFYLLIEQEPWAKDVGLTTNLQALAGIMGLIYGSTLPSLNCGGDPLGFDTDIYVYPSNQTTPYTFHISHGEYAIDTIETVTREEMKQCGLVESVELDYPPHGDVSLQWVGDCYDAEGGIIDRPTITRVGRKLSFSSRVYGSIRARYLVFRSVYKVRVEERDDAIENNFDSVVYCVWDGGVRWLECSPPSGYELSKGQCGNGSVKSTFDFTGEWGGGDDDNDDDLQEPDEAPNKTDGADLEIGIEYCSQIEIYRRTT